MCNDRGIVTVTANRHKPSLLTPYPSYRSVHWQLLHLQSNINIEGLDYITTINIELRIMRRHKSLTTPNKNPNHKQTRRHSSQVIISTNYELRDAILTKPPPPVDSNSSGSDNDNNVDDIKKARKERRRRRSRSRRRRKSLSSVNSKKKLQSNHDDMNPTNCSNNDSSIDILNGNHDQVLKDSLLLAKQQLHQPSSSTSLRRSLSHNEIYNCSTISLLDNDNIDIIPTKESNEHTNKMKSNLLACSMTTDSSASFVGTENKMLHISDDEQHSIVSSVDDSVDDNNDTKQQQTQQQKQQQGINKNKDNNNSSRTLNTSATTTSNPQPCSSPPNSNQPNKSQPLSQSIIMEEHIALKLNVAQLHTELQTSQIQLNKYTLGLQQATSGLKSAQLAIGKLQSKNIKLEERNEELESENYYLLILLKNLIDEGGETGKKGSLEEMLAPLKKNKGGVSSGKGKHINVKDIKGKGNGKEEVKGWKRASHWWKDRSNRSSDIDNKDDDDEVLVVQGLPLIDNSDRGAGTGGGSKASAQSNKSSYKPGASVRSLKSSNKSSSGASGWWGGNSNKNNRHRRSKSGEASEGCGSSWHTSAASGKGVGEGTELLDGVPSTLIDKIRNLSVTLSRGSNMAVDSSKQKRDKCQDVNVVDDQPPVPEYVQWNDDSKIDYCSDVSFDGIVDDDQQVNTNIGKANEKEEGEKKEKEEYKKDTNLITYSGTSQQSQQQHETTDTNMEERQHANSAQYSLNPGDDDTYDPSEYEFSDC